MRWLALMVVLAACSGDHEVTLRTVSEECRSPIAGVEVQLDRGAWRTSDATGAVRFHAAAGSHDVLVHQTSMGTTPSGKPFEFHDIWSFIDQTADSLTIAVDGSAVPTHHAMISGRVDGASGAQTQVLVYARAGNCTTAAQTVAAADGTFVIDDVSWEDDHPQTVAIDALERDASDPPSYRSYVHMTTSVDDGQAGTADLTLAPIDQSPLSFTVSPPAGFVGDLHRLLLLDNGNHSSTLLDIGTQMPGAFDMAFPSITPLQLAFMALASDGTTSFMERTLGADAIAIFALPPVATAIAPDDNATLDATTVFQWSSVPDGAKYGLTLACDWTTADGALHDVNFRTIETVDTQTTIPVIPGLEIPSGTACTWSVGWFDVDAPPYYDRRLSFSAEHPIRVQ